MFPKSSCISFAAKSDFLVCSLASGAWHNALLRIAAPTFEGYADLHRADFLALRNVRLQTKRPPSWDKIVLLREAVHSYEHILWLDADTLIVDPSRDAREELAKGEELVRLTTHVVQYRRNAWRHEPNAGVLLLRGGEETRGLLETIWEMERYAEHKWWEQAAIHELMGYGKGLSFIGETPFSRFFGALGNEWNSTVHDPHPNPLIKHYIPLPPEEKVKSMQADAGGPYPLTVRTKVMRTEFEKWAEKWAKEQAQRTKKQARRTKKRAQRTKRRVQRTLTRRQGYRRLCGRLIRSLLYRS
jgi:hypothetical protein